MTPTDTMMPVTPASVSTIWTPKSSGRTQVINEYSAIPLSRMPVITTTPSSR